MCIDVGGGVCCLCVHPSFLPVVTSWRIPQSLSQPALPMSLGMCPTSQDPCRLKWRYVHTYSGGKPVLVDRYIHVFGMCLKGVVRKFCLWLKLMMAQMWLGCVRVRGLNNETDYVCCVQFGCKGDRPCQWPRAAYVCTHVRTYEICTVVEYNFWTSWNVTDVSWIVHFTVPCATVPP